MMLCLFFMCYSVFNNMDLDSKVTDIRNPQMKTVLAQKAREEFKMLKNKENKPDLKNNMHHLPIWY